MRPDERIDFWDGETRTLGDGLTLVRCGGHFDGGTVLHWAAGNALLSGDVVQVVQDRRWVSFMYSYPNLIPLAEDAIYRIVDALREWMKESATAPRVASESIVRLLAADLVGEEPVVESLRARCGTTSRR